MSFFKLVKWEHALILGVFAAALTKGSLVVGRWLARRLYPPEVGYYSADEIWRHTFRLTYSLPSLGVVFSRIVMFPLSFDEFYEQLPVELPVLFGQRVFTFYRIQAFRNRLRRRLVLRDEPATRGE